MFYSEQNFIWFLAYGGLLSEEICQGLWSRDVIKRTDCWYKVKTEKSSNQPPVIQAHHRQHHVCTREEEARGILVFSACPFQAATQETEIIGRFWAFGMDCQEQSAPCS